MLKELVLATHNHAKILELKAMLSPYAVQVFSAEEFNLDEPEETGRTFQENALIKAKYTAHMTGKPALSDDSGICFPALNNFPGVDTAPFRKSFDTLDQCFQDLKKRLDATADYRAFFHSSLCLYFPDDSYQFFEGTIHGQFVYPVRGDSTKGYHFDIVFQPDGYDQTYAQLGIDIKNKISHRHQSFGAFLRTCFP